jgi:hypothetical protein
MKQRVNQPKDFRKSAHLGCLLKFVFPFPLWWKSNKNNITVCMTYVCDLSLGLLFVTETVSYVRYVLGPKNLSMKTKDCVRCEVRTEKKKQISKKHRAWSILNDEYQFLRDVYFKPTCLRYPVPSISDLFPREGNTYLIVCVKIHNVLVKSNGEFHIWGQ